MKTPARSAYSTLLLGVLLLPEYVFGQGLVPECSRGDDPTLRPCQFCDVVELVNNVVGWLVGILGLIGAIVIVYAGVLLVVSGGNASAKEKAKGFITNILIGYVLVLAGWLIIDTALKALLNDQNFGVWNQIQCVTQPVATVAKKTTIILGDVARPTATGFNQSSFTPGDVTASIASINNAGDVRAQVEEAARQAGITDPALIKTYTALIMQESSMCRNKTGPPTDYGTAYGCGQMLLSTARGLDPSATAARLRDDNAYNLALSSRLFKEQLERYNGDVRLTLASYNGGDKANANSTVCPGQLSWECEKNSGYAQTRHYVSNITRVANGL